MDSRYPSVAGFKERGATSQAAAEAIAPRVSKLRNEVLRELARAPKTADEVAMCLERKELAIRPRLSELRRLGLIEETGERRRNRSGLSAAVWRVRAQQAECAA